MNGTLKTLTRLLPLACLLTGCVIGQMPPPGAGVLPPGRHLTDVECRDLAALKTNTNPTMAQHQVELGALRKAGYDPSPFWDDPYYPEDLQYAQRLVDYWFRTECPPPPPPPQ